MAFFVPPNGNNHQPRTKRQQNRLAPSVSKIDTPPSEVKTHTSMAITANIHTKTTTSVDAKHEPASTSQMNSSYTPGSPINSHAPKYP
jgi:hypothetical protein